jgi:hypothetical protein
MEVKQMWLREYLEKYIFNIPEKESEPRPLVRKDNKKFCKGFKKGKKGTCRYYLGSEIANCYDRCALRKIKRQPKLLESVCAKL